MSLKDRLREAAQQAQDGLAKGAQQAQEGLAKGQAKLGEMQKDWQSADSELKTLGQAYWVMQSGRATSAQFEAVLDALRPAIVASEARSGPMPWPATPAAPSAPPPTPTVAAPAPGVSGPVGAPSSIPDAIHHDPPAE